MKKIVTIVLTILCIAQSFTIAMILKIDRNQQVIYQEKTNDDIYCVSLINLIASPEKFDGKRVRVDGVSCLNYEGEALYLSEYDYIHVFTKNSIRMQIDDSLSVDKDTNGKAVIVEGVFRKIKEGTIELHSGYLDDISRYELINLQNCD